MGLTAAVAVALCFFGRAFGLAWWVAAMGARSAAASVGAATPPVDRAATGAASWRVPVAWRTSTAPAVTIAAAAIPAAAFVAAALTPAEIAPLAAALPAADAPAPPAAPAPPPLAVVPRWASTSFLKSSSGPTGKMAASALFVSFSVPRKAVQRSQVLRCRRTGGGIRFRPSATSPSSSRTSPHESWRASAASASDTRARTRSDLTLGTVVSMASAIWS